MTDAREVLRDHFYGDCSYLPHHRHDDKCVQCETRAGGIIAALTSAGLVIVPKEPTEKMLKAGFTPRWADFDAGCTWRDMVEAASDE
jgi:hypothetical protein